MGYTVSVIDLDLPWIDGFPKKTNDGLELVKVLVGKGMG